MDSNHTMMTRSKKNISLNNPLPNPLPPSEPPNVDDDLDDNGNIKGLIDYSYDKKKKNKKKKNKKKLRRNRNSNPSMEEMTLSYMMMTMVKNMHSNMLNTNIKLTIDEIDDDDDDDESLEEELEEESLGEESLEEESLEESPSCLEELSLEEESINSKDDDVSSPDDDDDDDDDCSEYDELDEQFMEYEDNIDLDDEDEHLDYFHKLEPDKKELLLEEIKKVSEINDLTMPLKFKIYNSDMDLNTKAIAIRNVEKLGEMDVSTGEYSKMDKWINGLISIPFNKYVTLPIDNDNTIDEKRDFIINTKSILDKSIYGHNDAKTHILQVIGKWIKNPTSQGNVLALQGPMGNGKTTLVKEGISKAIGRPFTFIALGGQSDSSIFEGHSYTYEGSHWGRIIDILIESKCMNPVIYFDELDKVSESHKGEEIIHMLTHLTDPSQNSLFQDNYYPGINLDLSKVLFIFSFNDESKINRILKDRMYVINTKGFNTKEKINICKEYVFPELYDTYLFKKDEIIINDDILEYVIDKFTDKEEGVRNLKRSIESIISKINICYLTGNDEKIDLNFKIKDFKLPYTLNRSDVDNFLKLNSSSSSPPSHMYM